MPLPRRQLDSDIMNFLVSYGGKFDMYVEDDPAFVRYCFGTRSTQKFLGCASNRGKNASSWQGDRLTPR